MTPSPPGTGPAVREAAVAGQFYPGSAAELDAAVRQFLDAAAERMDDAGAAPVPKAIIAPHAGYVYSGAVAASAYATLLPARDRITRVVLLGPCHRVAVRGLALSSADAFRTPLGDVPVDREAATRLLALDQVQVFDATHELEHSLEVHLPFLQVALGDFAVVPLVVGEAPPDAVAEALDVLWGGPETVIVVSSDLSHYLDYESARAIDARTCKAIESLDPAAIESHGACGRFPVGGLLASAKKRGMTVTTLDLRNSGDTAGTKDRVVGYGSWMFAEAPPKRTVTVTWHQTGTAEPGGAEPGHAGTGADAFGAGARAVLDAHGETLVRLAVASIRHGLDAGKPLPATPADHADALGEPGAVFVTLKRDGTLRGCIGTAEAYRPLIVDVSDNAFRAAFKDPRFPALTADELDGLGLSLSVLGPQAPMAFAGEAELLDQLRPGVDGLVIQDDKRRALFLPSVWEQLPEPKAFLERLKIKAGMAKDHWSNGFRGWRFQAEELDAADVVEPDALWAAGR